MKYMERTLTLFAATLFTAPVICVLFAWLVVTIGAKPGSDATLDCTLLAILSGIAAAAAWIILLYRLAGQFITGPYLHYLQIANAILLCGWLVAAWMLLDDQPRKFEYSDRRAVLDVELRANASLLKGQPIEEVARIRFVGGEDFNLPHPEWVREEDSYVILPWETTLFSVQDWHVRVFLPGQTVSFKLNLPKCPESSVLWSDWFPPSRYEDDAMPDGLMLRYRFRLVPHGSQ
jgi:hypothetical protein